MAGQADNCDLHDMSGEVGYRLNRLRRADQSCTLTCKKGSWLDAMPPASAVTIRSIAGQLAMSEGSTPSLHEIRHQRRKYDQVNAPNTLAGRPIPAESHSFYVWADTGHERRHMARDPMFHTQTKFVTTAWCVVETVHLFVASRLARRVQPFLNFLAATRAAQVLSCRT